MAKWILNRTFLGKSTIHRTCQLTHIHIPHQSIIDSITNGINNIVFVAGLPIRIILLNYLSSSIFHSTYYAINNRKIFKFCGINKNGKIIHFQLNDVIITIIIYYRNHIAYAPSEKRKILVVNHNKQKKTFF